jgi:hypothetical protein
MAPQVAVVRAHVTSLGGGTGCLARTASAPPIAPGMGLLTAESQFLCPALTRPYGQRRLSRPSI